MEKYVSQFAALAHPQRLSVFRLLMRRYPDRVPAGEIGTTLDIRPSTLSGYLSDLAEAGLIEQERRGTSLRYAPVMAEAEGLTDYLWRDCCRARVTPAMPGKPGRVRNVLFLCVANSARSLMAEAILRQSAGSRFEAFSAGIDPRSKPDPQAMAMLRELRHETDSLYSKPVTQFRGDDAPQMDFVITVCNRAASADLAAWPGAPIAAHWPVPDPVELATPEAYAEAFLILRARIKALADLPSDLARPDLQRAVDRIATLEA
ncbi:helix-turn-helix domain-containing protein [Pararhodobacter sp. SW119]|uniref:arsenate reductase/protein-tyrosine-phosphatase family protein n=1 Tax=Pararhodobacter sp. SW119 TaxID=2780075 RepID=UPI001AE0E267|nr:helix-turn-helix domain-containing protein [Pararhodobacter sp. SW119]